MLRDKIKGMLEVVKYKHICINDQRLNKLILERAELQQLCYNRFKEQETASVAPRAGNRKGVTPADKWEAREQRTSTWKVKRAVVGTPTWTSDAVGQTDNVCEKVLDEEECSVPINGSVEMSMCPDTDAEKSILPASVIQQVRATGRDLVAKAAKRLAAPVPIMGAGYKGTLNVKRAFEQLANASIDLNRDDIPEEPEVGDLIEGKVKMEVDRLRDEQSRTVVSKFISAGGNEFARRILLAEECQEVFSFMTHDGVYTLLRVPQGATGSALHFHNQMQTVYKSLLYKGALIRIHAIVDYGRTEGEFLSNLKQFYELTEKYQLKLKAKKSFLMSLEVSLCGRIIDGKGVRQDSERSILVSLPLAKAAPASQRFVCACNWIRESMVDFARTTKRSTSAVTLGWTEEDRNSYSCALHGIVNSAKIYFPEDELTICLMADASNYGYAICFYPGSPPTVIVKVARVADLLRIRPLKDDNFTWPMLGAVCAAQDAAELPESKFSHNEQHIWVADGKVWFPPNDTNYITRVLYALVLKDDLYRYCELIPCESANGHVAANAVLDWCKRFGLHEMWQSDNESHFRNTLMDDLKARLGALRATQAIFTSSCTRSSARIQVGHQKLGMLTSGYPVEFEPNPCPIAHREVEDGGFHRTQQEPIMNVIVKPLAGTTTPDVVQRDNLNCEEKLEALGTRVKADDKRVGPFRVVEELPTTFLIEHLLTDETFDVHLIRLKHYADDLLEVKEELKHHVDTRNQARCSRCQGLEEAENSWESLESINAAVPEQRLRDEHGVN
ncbi:hypothetical protein ON010_g7014 [Phytophthora cinnamomi]|nr:hypothetical protein ON010_g7014 [Phytophthora cinnamomi]